MTEIETSVRLDKWLWVARFFKTRAIASHAISGGKVHEISRGQDRLQIIVLKLAQRRASATIAQTLYRETQPSIERREREAELRKLAAMQRPVRDTRPSKQERRKIHHFTRKT